MNVRIRGRCGGLKLDAWEEGSEEEEEKIFCHREHRARIQRARRSEGAGIGRRIF